MECAVSSAAFATAQRTFLDSEPGRRNAWGPVQKRSRIPRRQEASPTSSVGRRVPVQFTRPEASLTQRRLHFPKGRLLGSFQIRKSLNNFQKVRKSIWKMDPLKIKSQRLAHRAYSEPCRADHTRVTARHTSFLVCPLTCPAPCETVTIGTCLGLAGSCMSPRQTENSSGEGDSVSSLTNAPHGLALCRCEVVQASAESRCGRQPRPASPSPFPSGRLSFLPQMWTEVPPRGGETHLAWPQGTRRTAGRNHERKPRKPVPSQRRTAAASWSTRGNFQIKGEARAPGPTGRGG